MILSIFLSLIAGLAFAKVNQSLPHRVKARAKGLFSPHPRYGRISADGTSGHARLAVAARRLCLLSVTVAAIAFATPRLIEAGTDRLSDNYLGARHTRLTMIEGLDKDGRADALVVVAASKSGLTIIGVPRDALVPGTKWKLTEYAKVAGHKKLASVLQGMLGLSETPSFVAVPMASIATAVDGALPQGVPVTVAKEMLYRDSAQDLSIHLKPGRQQLKGKTLVHYMRYRSDARAATGRLERQLTVGRAIAAELRSNPLRAPAFARELKAVAKTDLSESELLGLTALVARAPTTYSVVLPAKGGRLGLKSIQHLEAGAVRAIVARAVKGLPVGGYVTVRVFNSNGKQGSAKRFATAMSKQLGLSASYTGNAQEIRSRSLLRYGKGQRATAEAVAALLHKKAEFREDLPHKSIHVYIGRDWEVAR